MSSRESLADRIKARPQRSIHDVLAVMEIIDGALPSADGVHAFNELYFLVTDRIRAELDRGRFTTPVLLEELDVVFATLYFDAFLAELRAPGSSPRAWQPLFESRSERSISRLQHALCGMNAHINHDLAIAVVETCGRKGIEPRRGTGFFDDYLLINDILEEAEKVATKKLATGVFRDVEEALGRVDNVMAMWSVRRARDAAWANAEVLWAIRDNDLLYETFLKTIDRMAGFAGRGLLLPRGFGGEPET
ncbi:DUF5995 family protein [Polyangium jinanense]|uniref:Uncharacterized protein n=1 Tax=Polyangium jinanense TaxID=2829994 RepID=A0A9X4AWY0_9BACT|nr:DUF5995 family protein [Polyangium jinanense]MDC3961868.1 hypothetical protein [Polyangium jinanense]MDC3987814.1 hypothetical protein [Polyangium jinanense]